MPHGSFLYESPTQKPSPIPTSGLVLVAVGTAPVNLTEGMGNVNTPILINSMPEYESKLGYSSDWSNYTLSEVADAAFNEFGVGPVVFINALDPTKHKKTHEPVTLTVENNRAVIDVKGILLSSLKLIADDSTISPIDYIASFNKSGNVTIAFLTNQTTVVAEFDVIDPSLVTEDDVIGGYDVDTGKASGIECLNKVLPRLKLIPGLVIAPGFSEKPNVAAVLRAKMSNINSYFKAFTLTDIDASQVKKHSDVESYKNEHGYTGILEAVMWPLAKLGSKVYRMSTQAACSMLQLCKQNNNFPYESASNKPLKIDSIVIKNDGGYEEVDLEPNQASVLNDQGVVTAINFINGWTLWGNNTAIYPNVDDVKDTFHSVRIMHNFIGNSIILNTWADVDGPIKPAKLQSIVDKMNIWMNGLQGAGVIIGGRVVALAEDNPKEQLLKGKVKIRYYVAESVPTQEIENVLEFDTNYYDTIFG